MIKNINTNIMKERGKYANVLKKSKMTHRLLVQFPVRAHAWVTGLVPGWGPMRGNQLMFFSLSFSLLSPLSQNK